MLRIAIVAAELSGDFLGAGLIRALKRHLGEVRFEGVAGPRMQAAGCHSLVPMERLSVMGLFEVLGHLPELLGIRRSLRERFLSDPPDLFIGVDAPDFNLGLERVLRAAGIPTVHYVSPTVWAWRRGRVKKLKRAVDLMLSIYPFETDFLIEQGVTARYVGHPLADEIPLESDRNEARRGLGLDIEAQIIALLPGSRMGEVRRLARPFLDTVRWLLTKRPGLQFVLPCASGRIRAQIEAELARVPKMPLMLTDGQARAAMAAADLVLTASGTATLEALLVKRPMVVAYRLQPLTYWLVRVLRLVKVPYVAMANLLAGRELAPELLQGAVTPQALGRALLGFLDNPARMAEIQAVYTEIHQRLGQDSDQRAAEAVIELLSRRSRGV
jgi:lipid-A-disaccharide synthase